MRRLALRSVNARMLLAFLVVSLFGIILAAAYVGYTTTREFHTFADARNEASFRERWAQYYRLQGSWEGIESALVSLWNPPPAPQGSGAPAANATPDLRGRPIMLVDAQRQVVLAGLGRDVGEQVPEEQVRGGLAIEVDGKVVGTLLMRERVPQPNQDLARERFLSRFSSAWLIGGGSAMLVALLLSFVLSRSITKPLKELTAATEAMSRGELSHELPVRSPDELGELTQTFNRMSVELARSQKLRRQMTADIAHELRTPLSLILGHAEALSDGILPPSKETFDIIYDEAQRLSRVVDDLRTLSLSDAGELSLVRVPTPTRDLLETAIAAHRAIAEARGVQLVLRTDGEIPDVNVDPDRIGQVLHNLLSNALRYTPEGGIITLSARAQNGQVTFAVADSGSGIPQEELGRVFERFYRGDQARHRADGGTGLGLAIARSIVEMHGGHIWAESPQGSGAIFTFRIPIG